jgi:hypothetical protein
VKKRARDCQIPFTIRPQLRRELALAEGYVRHFVCNNGLRRSDMRIQFAAAAAVLTLCLSGAAFAQPMYSNDYTNDSDGFAPVKVAPPKPVHYTQHKAPEYSDDYTNDSDGFAPVRVAPPVDKMSTASIKPLPPCDYSPKGHGLHTAGGDSGASHTDACRDVGTK